MLQQVARVFNCPTIPSNLVTALLFLVRFVLFVVQIGALLGIPSGTVYFAWFTRDSIWPVLPEKHISEGQEVFAYLVYITVFMVFFLWGVVAFLSVRIVLPLWALGCMSAVMSCLVLAFLIMTIRTMFLTWKWWIEFEKIPRLTVVARHCRAISVFLFFLLFIGCALSLGYCFYYSIHGTPDIVARVIEDMQGLLHFLAGRDSNPTTKVDL
ncbi:hypothetical protein FOXG_20928 [Fusarium oxysporum f. sp. lycopersici 4287]|uniref:Uncharacterized protein n=1 Tax=Fusarium oxysporum f. sp. lycopersici (strain 4287 / CBS 123668 / FGSC 9935 / NRRL 34936) TaxID=426428 RepID=A0A0J9VT24_FUSO4|nr:hypothetical protein FOXG_20928 [Fusarium oxysporum f. sp. lycopersici 4287]EWZ79208.1 hypothetical protein FOWG_16652 [Fusarium oxysporum f. sp. lycopersici MN25]KAJ9413039.1 hypothetical protein QL093DRAFT_2527224 [Fusarium oxysporum]KNB13800.1 hypothetical protein FOXG_20928 [Fusarium oxysporum f. sp. lycopersici 4287]